MVRRTLQAVQVFGMFLGLGFGSLPAFAQPEPSSELLVPYFEVDLGSGGVTTQLDVGNVLEEPVAVTLTLHTNWGIAVSEATPTLAPREVRTIDLRSWLSGTLPGRTLTPQEREHLRAALSGKRSPRDNLFYSTPAGTNRAVGYVRIQTRGVRRPALWGQYALLDSSRRAAQADMLVNLDRSVSCPGLCLRRVVRFLAGTDFPQGTELVIWNGREGRPSREPSGGDASKVAARARVFAESGQPAGEVRLQLLPVELVSVRALRLSTPAGWLDFQSDVETFIGLRHNSARHSVALASYCLKKGSPPPPPPPPGIRLRKLTNGDDANSPPGPSLQVGSSVRWEYVVENTGGVALRQIRVVDDQGVAVSCPQTTLDPGQSMTCTARGTAVACQYANRGRVTARNPENQEITAEDPSHYFGQARAEVRIEKRTNGQDADAPPGPEIPVGAEVRWEYVVTNSGEVALGNVRVEDDHGVRVSCPKNALQPGETMSCLASGTATAGQYRNVGTVSGTPPPACGSEVQAQDLSHYLGKPPRQECPGRVGIQIKKRTNGQDADAPPGPEIPVGAEVRWEYVVTNSGEVALGNVRVEDDHGVRVSCPKNALQPGETMSCSASSTATAGQYRNVGTALGTPPPACGPEVRAQDPSHYFGKSAQAGPEGCTPGYWKNHSDSWPPTGFSTSQRVQSVFSQASLYPALGSATLLEGLSFRGGPGLDGAAEILLRAAIASLLNASHPELDGFPRETAEVIRDVDAALASRNRDQMLALATALDRDNNLGCPLN